jgi:anaerobic carbon-monoxide dehydrogenase iron sulfur subunit
MKRIYCEIEKCLACRSCELACATAHAACHSLPEAIRESALPRPRIHVEAIDEKGRLHPVRAIAIQCRHCEEPACALACISGGIRKDEETGAIVINLEKCVGCWSCIMVCPIGAIRRNENRRQALKCDRCQDLDAHPSPDARPSPDAPACITACPTGALILCEEAALESK